MKQFTDSEGRKWNIVVNVRTAKKVRDVRGVDLFRLHMEEAGRVFTDPCLLVEVLYDLCEQQVADKGISDMDFIEGIAGDCLDEAAKALMESVEDFFPQSKREALRRIRAKGTEIGQEMEAAALRAIDAMKASDLTSSASATN